MSVGAVLFDMDGTLVDSEPTHYDAFVDAVARQGLQVPKGFAAQITGMSIADCHAALVRSIALPLTLDELVDAKNAAYLTRAPGLKRRFGVDAALDLLGGYGIPYAVVSNSDRLIADANLRVVGLARPGLVSVTRIDVRHGKPDPEPYLRAAYLLGVSAEDCLVVEDSPVGAQAGLSAGMRVIGWAEPHRSDLVFPPGCLPADPVDLVSLLAGLLAPHTARIA